MSNKQVKSAYILLAIALLMGPGSLFLLIVYVTGFNSVAPNSTVAVKNSRTVQTIFEETETSFS